MLIDARELTDGSVIQADLCIAGAGAAGITIARELLDSKLKICLLEGGGKKFSPDSQAFYGGRCEPPLPDAYLRTSRLRLLGGTTNHWLGFCRPLDDIDFEERTWVPHSGWPFDAATLAPFYQRAADVCRLRPTVADSSRVVPDADCHLLTTPFRVQPTRFGKEYRSELRGSSTVEVFLHANVVNIDLGDEGQNVEQLQVATPDGPRFTVAARRFVLAMGGLENPRLMLVSRDVDPEGVGNHHDLVGRYFMDHPVFPVGDVCVSGEDSPWIRPLDDADWHGYRIDDAEQRRRQILNCCLAFGRVPETKDSGRRLLKDGTWTAITDFLATRDAGETLGFGSRRAELLHAQGFSIRPEQAPNPDSRVTLSDETDRFGNRRVHLHWQLSDIDVETARQSLEALAIEAGRFGLGRIRQDPGFLLEASFSPGSHHMGTTRMHDDPCQGVVDPDCRVHGIDNLYVAGSSVFPTSGYANPTLTLVALAVRLSDHLRQSL